MSYREFRPDTRLERYVQLLWTLQLDDPSAFGPAERIVPDCVVELVLHVGTPFGLRFGGRALERQPRCFLLLQARHFVDISPLGAAEFVSVRFRPGGAAHFMDVPLNELADRVLDAREVWGAEIEALVERVAAEPRAEERARCVERFLLRQLARYECRTLELVLRELDRNVSARTGDVARSLGVAERTLQRLVASGVGVSPKRYVRVRRFLAALKQLEQRSNVPLAGLALERGYYDQAHLNRDFRQLAGMSPREFVRRGLSFLDVDDVGGGV